MNQSTFFAFASLKLRPVVAIWAYINKSLVSSWLHIMLLHAILFTNMLGVMTGCLVPPWLSLWITWEKSLFHDTMLLEIAYLGPIYVFPMEHIMAVWPSLTASGYLRFMIFKSPRSGVTLCFQFLSGASAASAVSAATAAKNLPSHVKTIWAKHLIFGTTNIWVWGNVLDDLSITLTQGHGCGVH